MKHEIEVSETTVIFLLDGLQLREQPCLEDFKPGDRVRVIVEKVKE